MDVRLPRLLDSGFGEARRIRPGNVAAKINLDALSTATITMPDGELPVAWHQWIELFRKNNSLGLFRVANVNTNYGSGQRLALEHGLVVLGEYLTAQGTDEDGKPADLELTGTPAYLLSVLLGYQKRMYWQAGAAPTAGDYTLKVRQSNVLTTLFDLLKQLRGYRLTYDFTTRPWTLGIAAMEATPSCECRMSRNLTGVSLSVDDSEYCTRVYAAGLPNGYLDAVDASSNEVVERTLGTPNDAEAGEVQAYALEYLQAHQYPRISGEMNAVDLSEQTGEPLDALAVGKLCRVALPDYGYTVNLRLLTESYNDLLGSPDDVKVTLSNKPKDVSRTLASVARDLYGTSGGSYGGGGGYGGASGKGAQEEISLRVTKTKFDALGKEVVETQSGLSITENCLLLGYGAGTLEDLAAGLVNGTILKIDGSGATLKSKLEDAESAIAVNANGISLASVELNRLDNTLAGAMIDIDRSKQDILLQAGTLDDQGRLIDGALLDIDGLNSEITLKADKITLEGYVTISQLNATAASIENSFSQYVGTITLDATNVACSQFTFRGSGCTLKEIPVLSSVTPASTQSVTILTAT